MSLTGNNRVSVYQSVGKHIMVHACDYILHRDRKGPAIDLYNIDELPIYGNYLLHSDHD